MASLPVALSGRAGCCKQSSMGKLALSKQEGRPRPRAAFAEEGGLLRAFSSVGTA
jgi:hypothetical protein